MPRLRFPGMNDGLPPLHRAQSMHSMQPKSDMVPFPRSAQPRERDDQDDRERNPDVLYAFEKASRRMEDLARTLGCLGFFDDDDDRPRAA